jgi:hypothetical protein
MEETPVQDAQIVDATMQGQVAAEKPKVSPAQDLRNIQALIVNGIFPGNVAPEVVKAYKLLEDMAQVVEKAADVASK